MTERPPAGPGAVEPIESQPAAPPQSPWRVFWRQFRRSHLGVAGGVLLVAFYGLALLAPFIAPYSQEEMDRERFFHPPHRLHWLDARGHLHVIPFVHPTRLVDPGNLVYREDRSRV